MLKSLLVFHYLSLLFFFYVSPLYANENIFAQLIACHPRKIQALTQFKSEFDTQHCNHSDYSNGVWCDNLTGEITMLRLTSCLKGTLKPNSSLFKLHHLRYLDLFDNYFISSTLPSEFGNLDRLKVLSLSFNGFFGQVPSSFSNLSLLTELVLSQNELTGSFPVIRKLSILDLSYNHFSGTLNPNSSFFEMGQLRYLNIDENNFISSIPSEFGNLNKLEYLSLSSNGFLGQVPSSISNLSSLTELYLSKNQLSGSFPLVQNLTKLSVLYLSDNYFFGTIPSFLLTMPFLSHLDMRRNNFSGTIEVRNSSTSSRLEFLLLGHNKFEGNILEPISKLINLKDLDVSYSNIGYPIDLQILSTIESLFRLELSGNSISPTSLKSYSKIPLKLKWLIMSSCGLSEFPNILKSLENLELIVISNNRISGKIPKWLWSLPRLNTLYINNNLFKGFQGSSKVLVNSPVRFLSLGFNNFGGALPSLPHSIKAFYAPSNSFVRDIPLSICNISSLDYIALDNNSFTGPIPHCLSNFMIVTLRRNNLEGSIPDAFFKGASLRTLDVGFNRITGKLPRSLLNCSFLELLVVDNNKLKDTFPFWLKALPKLQVIILRKNKFYGPISPHDQRPLGFPRLHILEISNNNFTGSLSPSYFVNWKTPSLAINHDKWGLYMVHENDFYDIHYIYYDVIDLYYKGLSMENKMILTSYATIDFSGNRLGGKIPESIGLLKALIALNLSNNAFTGNIPMSLANVTELESLDLSRNQLSGTIPSGLKTLTFLAYINVSHNQLKGEIPQGTQIIGQPKSSFEGNVGLCGLPLDESCYGNNSPPTQHPEQEEDGEEQVLNWKAMVIGYGAGMLFGLAIAHVIASHKPEWLAKITGLKTRKNR